MNGKTVALILAAGNGTRFGGPIAKQYRSVADGSVLGYAVDAFERSSVDAIILVVREGDVPAVKAAFLGKSPKVSAVVAGGAERRTSAKRGFEAAGGEYGYIAVHDAARCLVTPEMIDSTVRAAKEHGTAILASAVTDTVKRTDGFVLGTIPRDALAFAETPQIFRTDLYARALAASEGIAVTDDASMAEAAGIPVKVVFHDGENRKITSPDDLRFAEYILKERRKDQ